MGEEREKQMELFFLILLVVLLLLFGYAQWQKGVVKTSSRIIEDEEVEFN